MQEQPSGPRNDYRDRIPESQAMLAGRVEARYFIILLLLEFVAVLLLFFVESVGPYTHFLVMSSLFVLALNLVLTYLIFRKGTSKIPLIPAFIGLVLTIAGPLFDIAVTYIHTPDLSREGNVVARHLLDNGLDIQSVLLFGLIAQGIYTTCISLTWLSILRHRTTLLESIGPERSPLLVLKNMTGGSELSWRQWFLPLKISELPNAYHLYFCVGVVLVSATAYRYLLGFEWLGLVNYGYRTPVLIFSIIAGLIAYYTWIMFGLRKTST